MDILFKKDWTIKLPVSCEILNRDEGKGSQHPADLMQMFY